MVFPRLSGLRPGLAPATLVSARLVTDLPSEHVFRAAEASGGSWTAVVAAAWARLLLEFAEYDHPEDLRLGITSLEDHGHDQAPTPGPSVVPCRVRPFSGARETVSNSEVIRQVAHQEADPSRKPSSSCSNDLDTVLAFSDGSEQKEALHRSQLLDLICDESGHAIFVETYIESTGLLTFRLSSKGGCLDEAAAGSVLQVLNVALHLVVQRPSEAFNGGQERMHDLMPIKLELEHSMDDFNDSATLLHAPFEGHARRAANDAALIFASALDKSSPLNTCWTYGQVNRMANVVANALLRSPRSTESAVVPIVSERCPELYPAILGVLKAGKAWCPIDLLSPPTRRHDLILRTDTSIVLTTGSTQQNLDGLPEGMEVIDATELLMTPSDYLADAAPVVSTTPEDMAYLIWTSGTTGPPKGVPVSHRAASAAMASLHTTVPQARHDVVKCLQFSQNTFDVFVQDLFYTWGLGGTLIASTRELMIGSLAKLATEFQATHAHLTPAFAARLPRRSCPTLEVVTMIGEALPQNVADDWSKDIRAFNTYGPAEAAVVSTVQEFSGPGRQLKSTIIGRPLRSVDCHVLKAGLPALPGCIGELALSGPHLADGYFRDTEKSALKFVGNEHVGRRVYMTGDLVRQLPNGALEFIGREDDLVKVNGIRVELGEISYVLQNCHPLVDHVETGHLLRPDRPAKALVCFLACEAVEEPTSAANPLLLRGSEAFAIARVAQRVCHQELPNYMRPEAFVVLRGMPRTPSAKVDRKALQRAYEELDLDDWERSMGDANASPTREEGSTSRTATLALGILSSFCEVPSNQITGNTHMASLSVDSLGALLLAGRLRDAGIHLGPGKVASSRTVGDFLGAIEESGQAETETQSSLFDLRSFHEEWHHRAAIYLPKVECFVMPTTPLQQSLLAETLVDPKAYWSHHLYDLPRTSDMQRLRRAWEAAARHIEMLRTSFVPAAELSPDIKCEFEFVQLIHEQSDLSWTVLKIASDSEAHVEQTVRKASQSAVDRHRKERPKDPPWAITIILSPDRVLMMLTLHHALHDQDSIDLIIEAVRAEYEGREGDAARSPQLRDVLATLLHPDDASRQLSVAQWTEALRPYADLDASSWPDLTGKREPKYSSEDRALLSQMCRLSTPRHELIKAAQQYSTSLTSLVRAAWGLLVLSYFDASKCILGEVRSERLLYPELESTIAPLITVRPVTFSVQSSVRDFVTEHHESALRTLDYRSPPPALVRSFVKKAPQEALYASIFVYHNRARGPERKGESDWRPSRGSLDLFVEHPTAFNVYDEGDHYCVEVFAQASLLSQTQVDLLGTQLDALLAAMVRFPDRSFAQLKNIMPQEARACARSTIPVTRDHGSLTCSTYWLDYFATHRPSWAAVEVAEDVGPTAALPEYWTFRELHKLSNRFAARLNARGLSSSVIALCTERSLPSYAAILGIFKSGNTYLPIDENLPLERKRFLLQDSACAALVADHAYEGTFEGMNLRCQLLKIDEILAEEESLANALVLDLSKVDPDQSAYLLYTSGSTGKPKGVLISHRGLCNFVEGLSGLIEQWHPIAGSLGGIGKFLGLASRAFDVHLCEMFVAWRLGLRTVTAPREALLNDLRQSLMSLGVTHACFVPSLLDQSGLEPHDVPDLVYFSVGGEKITPKTLDTWASQTNTLVVNAYGPTELAIGCCASRLRRDCNARNVGGPYGNTEVHILNPDSLDYVLRGESGELCFTGGLVGNGYLNRPDAKGFVDGFHGERMYRTGDIGRMMADGSIEYLGRSDDQAKIRGQRIELGEVSKSIQEHSPIPLDVATLLVKHSELPRPQLVACVSQQQRRRNRYNATPQLQGDSSVRTGAIYEGCKSRLPAYMVPDILLPVSVIPLAPVSGKADTKSLRTLFQGLSSERIRDCRSATHGQRTLSRPLNVTERLVEEAIHESMSLEKGAIHPDTHIFELGFDSLSVIGLCMRLRRRGFDVGVPTLFAHPTISQLGSFWRSRDRAVEPSRSNEIGIRELDQFDTELRSLLALDAVSVGDVDHVHPCLPLQEAMVAKSVNDEESHLYINQTVVRLEPHTTMARLRRAMERLVQEMPILRTCFASTAKGIVQVAYSPETMSSRFPETVVLIKSALTADFEARRSETCRQIIQSIWSQPPFRAYVLWSSATDTYQLEIFIHHALYDAVSLQMALNHLYCHYAELPVPPAITSDDLLEHHLRSNKISQRDFWTDYLAGCPAAALQSDPTNKGMTLTLGHRLATNSSDLQFAASRYASTLSTFLQFIFAKALSHVIGQDDVVFGVVLSGRTVPLDGVERIAAPCITTIPRRLKADSELLNNDALAFFNKTLGQCLEHQFTSLRDIKQWLKREEELFDCLFAYLPPSEVPLFKPHWTVVDSVLPLDYPLAVEVEPSASSNSLIIKAMFKESPLMGKLVHALLDQMDTLSEVAAKGGIPQSSSLSRQIIHDETTRSPPEPTWDEFNWSPEERLMREIVSKFSEIDEDQISKNAGFFSLGIDSISSIQLANELRKVKLRVRSSDVMKHSSIGALWHHISSLASPTAPADTASGANDPRKEHVETRMTSSSMGVIEYPCTPLQSGMLSMTLASAGNMYVHHHVLGLDNETAVARLKQAWETVTSAFDILRTSFQMQSNGSPWAARVEPISNSTWEDLAAEVDIHSALEALKRGMTFESSGDFGKPPVRATHVTDGKKQYLILSMHHALYDGNSIQLLLDALSSTYRGEVSTPTTPFHEVARNISAMQPQAIDFWARTLQGYCVGSEVSSQSPDTAAGSIQKQLQLPVTELMSGARQLNVTLQAVLLLAFSKVLCRIYKRRDVVFGLVLSGRSLAIEGVEDVVGPVFNTVPFRTRLDDSSATNRDAVQAIQRCLSDCQEHQLASLKTVQDQWRKETSGPKSRLINSLFVFQKSRDLERQREQAPWITDDRFADPLPEYPLNVEVTQDRESVTIAATSFLSLLPEGGLQQLLDDFQSILGDIVSQRARRACNLPPELRDLPIEAQGEDDPRTKHPEGVDDNQLTNLRRIMAEFCGMDLQSIGPSSNVFHLGIDSITAITLAAECRKGGIPLTVANILQGETLSAMLRLSQMKAPTGMKRIKKLDGSNQVDELQIPSRLLEDNVEDVVPCLSGQAYHLARQTVRGHDGPEPTFAYRTRCKLDIDRFETAWGQLVKNHEILRAVFATSARSTAYQLVLRPESPRASANTIRHESRPWVECLQAHASIRFDLRTPPIQAGIVEEDESDIVVLTLHHALYDAWSLPMLLSDLLALYNGQALEERPSFTRCVRDSLRRLAQLDEAAFWRDALREREVSLAMPRQSETVHRGKPPTSFVSATALQGQARALEARARRHGASPPVLALLAFARLVARRTGAASPTFGHYHAARSDTGALRVAGPLVNVLPLVVPAAVLRGPWREQAAAVRAQLAARLPYEQSRLDRILAWAGAERAPLFNMYLNVLWHRPDAPDVEEDGFLQPVPVEFPAAPDDASKESGRPPVSGPDWPVSDTGIWVDVALRAEEDAVQVAAKCVGDLADPADLKGRLERLATEMEEIVEGLEREAGATTP